MLDYLFKICTFTSLYSFTLKDQCDQMAWLILLNILHIYKYKRLVNSLKISQSSFTLRDQSDQMARLFVQYLDIYQNTKLPNSIKIGQGFAQF